MTNGNNFDYVISACNSGGTCNVQATVSQTQSHTFRLNVTGLGLSDNEQAFLKVEGTTACVGFSNLAFTYRSYDALNLDEIGGIEADGSAAIEFMKCFPDYVSWDAVSNAVDYDGVQGTIGVNSTETQRLFYSVSGSSAIGTVGSSVDVGTYDLILGPTDDRYDECVATDSVSVSVNQFTIAYDGLQLTNGKFHMTDPCLYDLVWTANVARIGYQVVELQDVNGTVVKSYTNETREQRLSDIGSSGVSVGNYTLVIRARDFSDGCIANAVVDVVVNTPGLQCLDQFATNTFVEEDTSGVSLALILGIAIPAGLVAAGLMAVGILYYLKKKRDSNLAVKKLEALPEEQDETKKNLDPLAGDDIFDDGGFGDEMDAVIEQGNDTQRQLKDKERLIKAREKELADLVRKIKKMDGGSARLRSEGL